MLLWFTGCSARQYRERADREVYQIIRETGADVLGTTNDFGIGTAYTERPTAEILPPELVDDRSRGAERTMTLDDALDLAVTNSRRYQSEKERLYLTALTLAGERREFRPQFLARSTGRLTRSSDGERSVSVGSQLGVDQLLATGGSLGVTLANDFLRYYTGDPRRSVVSSLSVNLVQPLLRGFGRNNAAVESLTQAERNVVYGLRNFAFFQDQFAVEIVGDYFALLAQKDFIRNRYTNFLGRVQSTRRLEARAKDREPVAQVDQARQAELSARNNYVNALASYRNSLDQFKIKLALPLGERLFLEDAALDRVSRRGLVPAELDVEQAYRFAVERQAQVLNAIDQFEDSKRKVRIAADRLKADLSLFADASLDSDRPTDYTDFDPDQIRAGVGVQLDLPVNRFRERNNYRATLITFEAELRDLTLTLDSLRDSILRGLRTLAQRRQNYEIQRNALELANRRVLSTELLLQAGRAEVRDLVEAQDAQIAAQNAVTTALVDHQEARLQLMLAIGALDTGLEQFWLQDHLRGVLSPPATTTAAALGADSGEVVPPEEFFKQ